MEEYGNPASRAIMDAWFVSAFNVIQHDVHVTAQLHGWWDEERTGPHCMALVITEIAEAIEAMRSSGTLQSEKIAPHSAEAEELADAIIRIMDYAESEGFDIASALLAKMEYNRKRPYRHGGKVY